MTRHSAVSEAIELDGTDGATRAPLVRAALSLAAITQRPFVVHSMDGPEGADLLAAVEAARVVFGGRSETDTSEHTLTCEPGPLKAGSYRFESAAASLAPLLEMVSVPLALAGAPSDLRATGVTHFPNAPSFHEFAFGWLPVAERLGLTGEFRLDAAGFWPEAAGLSTARVYPAPRLRPIESTQRGMLVEVQAIVLLANLGIGIALPMERRLNERLRTCGIAAQTEILPLPVERGRGVAVAIVAQFEHTRVAFSVVGEAGRPAEALADEVVDRLQAFLRRRGLLPGEVAERILVPLALASSSFGAPGALLKAPRGSSRISTSEVTGTLLAVAGVVRRFLDVEVQIQGLPGGDGVIEIRPD
jgi:RNA 3'-terminal phosphate cyclase (ATP)